MKNIENDEEQTIRRPMHKPEVLDYIEQADPKAIIFHDLDDAIRGINQHGELVYGYSELIDVFMEDHLMTHDEAVEWIDYNVIGVNAGHGFQILYE